jgi:hypothetical protein
MTNAPTTATHNANTRALIAAYPYPTSDFTIVANFHVAYENSAKSGASGFCKFTPVAVRNCDLGNNDAREAAYGAALARVIRKHNAMVSRGAAERVCVVVASGDNDRQRFNLNDADGADSLARFMALNDVRPITGRDALHFGLAYTAAVTPRWVSLAIAGMVGDAATVAPKASPSVKPWEVAPADRVAPAATEAPMVAEQGDADDADERAVADMLADGEHLFDGDADWLCSDEASILAECDLVDAHCDLLARAFPC